MKGIRFKKVSVLVLSAALIFSPVSNVKAATFTDVSDSYWAIDHVEKAHSKGLMNGRGNGNFDPDGNITRAEFLAIVNNIFQNAQYTYDYEAPKDIAGGYTKVITKALGMGYLAPYEDGSFKPDVAITRGEAISVLANAFLLEGDVTKDGYKDTKNLPMAEQKAIAALKHNEIISGNTDNTFRAETNITRAQAAAIFNKLVKQVWNTSETLASAEADGKVIVINKPGVTVKGLTSDADIYITSNVGEAGIIFDNCTLTGRIIVQGGGDTNPVKFVNGTKVATIVADKRGDQALRLLFADTAKATNVKALGNVKIEQVTKGVAVENLEVNNGFNGKVDLKNTDVKKVSVVSNPASDAKAGKLTISSIGKVDEVSVGVSGFEVAFVGSSTVKDLNVLAGVDGAKVNLGGGFITKLSNKGTNTTVTVAGKDVPVTANGNLYGLSAVQTSTPASGGGTYIPPTTVPTGPTGPVTPTNVAVTGVTLDKTTLALGVGATGQLTATVAPAGATNKAVTWNSSNTAIATVSTTGLVTAVASGTATITVTTVDGSFTRTCAVTVSPTAPVAVTGVTLDKSTLALSGVGATGQLTATVAPTNAADKTVTWSTSAASVATVDSTGKVTAVTAGTATITATSNANSAKFASCAVTVTTVPGGVAVTGVTMATTASVIKENTVQLTATVAPTNATDAALTWASSDTAIATVDQTGLVKGLSKGTAKITATSTNGKKAECTVTVGFAQYVSDQTIKPTAIGTVLNVTIDPAFVSQASAVTCFGNIGAKNATTGVWIVTLPISSKATPAEIYANTIVTLGAAPTVFTPPVVSGTAKVTAIGTVVNIQIDPAVVPNVTKVMVYAEEAIKSTVTPGLWVATLYANSATEADIFKNIKVTVTKPEVPGTFIDAANSGAVQSFATMAFVTLHSSVVYDATAKNVTVQTTDGVVFEYDPTENNFVAAVPGKVRGDKIDITITYLNESKSYQLTVN